MKLISDKTFDHFSKDVIDEFEGTIARLSELEVVHTKNHQLNDYIFKFLRRFPYKGRMVLDGSEEYFVILMGIWYLAKSFPYFLKARKRHLYMFDAWFEAHDVIERLIKVCHFDTIFFSSRLARNVFQEKKVRCNCKWVPEGVNPQEYYFRDYDDRDIDVLNFGRKWDWYHDKIKDTLERKRINYLYEKKWFDVIFESHDEFKRGLSRAKISICFPKNISHPEIAGPISTMTNRYLQSMVSKTLIVGMMPDEMKLLFDYTPVVEIDQKHPKEQLLDILENYESYIPLIEKNYETVCREHTWERRWAEIARYLGVPYDKSAMMYPMSRASISPLSY